MLYMNNELMGIRVGKRRTWRHK